MAVDMLLLVDDDPEFLITVSGVYTRDVLDSAKVFGAAPVLAKPVTPEWMATVDRLRSIAAHS